MRRSLARLIVGTGTAFAIAFTIAVPSLRGISTWKYALAAVGVVLFVWGSVDRG
jgi:hypothetical protein